MSDIVVQLESELKRFIGKHETQLYRASLAEIARLRAEKEELLNALDDIIMAKKLPGEHCEMEQALDRAESILSRARGTE